MNVQDVVTRVRRTFGDEAAVQVSDADVIRWINDAMVEIVKNNDQALQQTTLLNLVANQATYALPADLLLLRALRYKYADQAAFTALKYRSMQQFDEIMDGWDGTLYNTGCPIYFTRDAGNVILFPTPDQASASGLKVLYNERPDDVTGLVDAIPLPLIYHNSIFKYCMMQAAAMDEDHEPALMWKQDFQIDLDTLKNRETKDPTDVYPTITVLADDNW